MGMKGGKKLAAFLKKAKAAQRRQGEVRIDVGFIGDALIAGLAAELEFGNPDRNLPERPAFRRANERIKRELAGFVAERINPRTLEINHALAMEIAEWAVDIVKSEYHAFADPPEGERQLQRKGGQSDPLVGVEGPKLIERIAARIVA